MKPRFIFLRYVMIAVIVGNAALAMGQDFGAPVTGVYLSPPPSSGIAPVSTPTPGPMSAAIGVDSLPAFTSPMTEYVSPGASTQPQACGPASALWGNYCGDTGNFSSSSWGQFDVLFWNLDGYATPALITRAPGGVVENASGALGGQGTEVLYGNQELGDDLLLGGRWQFGSCTDSGLGVQADLLALGAESGASFAGNGRDIHARPFFNTDPQVNREDGLVFAMPGITQGNAQFDMSSEVVSVGITVNLNDSGGRACNGVLLGYRFLRIEDTFAARSLLVPDAQTFGGVSSLAIADRVRTRNDFHGLEFGVRRGSQVGSLYWDVAALCALGEVERVVDLNGSATVAVDGSDEHTFPGGFHTAPDGLGRFRDVDFAAVPQVRANVSYCLGSNWRLSAGYNFMYLSSAFRPGQFLNTTLDGSRLAQHPTAFTLPRVRPNVRRDDALLHGATAGLMYSF